MIKLQLIITIMLNALIFNAQDTLVKKSSNLTHLVGVDVGYSDYGGYTNSKGEFNLNYVFNPYFFCMKAQFGITPSSNFGTLTKAFISMGFSTKIDKIVSWHLLTGFGWVIPSHTYYDYPSHTYYDYRFHTINAFLETGFYINPFKNKKHVFGINSTSIPYEILYGRYFTNGVALNVNLSYNFKINK